MRHNQNDALTLHGYTIDSIHFHSAPACEPRPGANDGYFNIVPHKRADVLSRSDIKSALSKVLVHVCTLPADYHIGDSPLEAFVSTV